MQQLYPFPARPPLEEGRRAGEQYPRTIPRVTYPRAAMKEALTRHSKPREKLPHVYPYQMRHLVEHSGVQQEQTRLCLGRHEV